MPSPPAVGTEPVCLGVPDWQPEGAAPNCHSQTSMFKAHFKTVPNAK